MESPEIVIIFYNLVMSHEAATPGGLNEQVFHRHPDNWFRLMSFT
jgi:hypothetical protein